MEFSLYSLASLVDTREVLHVVNIYIYINKILELTKSLADSGPQASCASRNYSNLILVPHLVLFYCSDTNVYVYDF